MSPRGSLGVASAASVLVLLAVGGCSSSAPKPAAASSGTAAPAPTRSPTSITVTSSAFGDHGAIPAAYTCDAPSGAAVSPPLKWSGVPAGTAWLALYAYDNTGSVVHWVVVDLKPTVSSLPSGGDGGGVEVANYLPMCPGAGNTDLYQFTIYAEPADYHPPKIGGQYAVDPDQLAAHALGIGDLIGYYSQ